MTPEMPMVYPQHVDEVQQRSARALERGGFDHLLVPSGTLHYQVFDDRDYPYAVNPQFKAWLPLTRNPGSWIVYTPGNKPKLLYLQPADYWHAVPEAPRGYWVDAFEIVVIRKPEEALQHFPADPSRCAILGERSSAVGDYVPDNPQAVIDYLDYHRAIKTPYEIEMMREASRRGVRAHRAAERAFRAGASEFGIHLVYCQAARQDACELPYGSIIALNEHGAVLHYTDRDRVPPKEIRSFLIDAGASHGGYNSDITRTYAMDTAGEFQQLVNAVEAAEQRLCAGVRAGVDYRQIHLDAHLEMAKILREAGIVDMAPESMVETGVSAKFFPHGIGHYIGLQVHDVGGFLASDGGGTIDRPAGHPFLRLTRVLEPGAVVTIEPGIYFADLLMEELRGGAYAGAVNWDKVDALRPFGGIRVEDDVVCTDGEPVNLTREAFAELG
jgi:Xaa-Pro dipeptidase